MNTDDHIHVINIIKEEKTPPGYIWVCKCGESGTSLFYYAQNAWASGETTHVHKFECNCGHNIHYDILKPDAYMAKEDDNIIKEDD